MPRYAKKKFLVVVLDHFWKQPTSEENEATLQMTESILSDYYCAFSVGKEAEESVHRR